MKLELFTVYSKTISLPSIQLKNKKSQTRVGHHNLIVIAVEGMKSVEILTACSNCTNYIPLRF